jgi:peptidoglycan/LPS O-acetylase OafA/YrhL
MTDAMRPKPETPQPSSDHEDTLPHARRTSAIPVHDDADTIAMSFVRSNGDRDAAPAAPAAPEGTGGRGRTGRPSANRLRPPRRAGVVSAVGDRLGGGVAPPVADDSGPVHRPIGYLPAFDGLRALAVIAVIAYHAGLSWMPGGLLGVDAFFVLSGFLITGLLINEYRMTRRIDLKAFWTRRARRLLPALLLMLLGVAAYAEWLADPGSAGSIRLDALATLFYVANWRFALSDQSYFDRFADPSPLLHTWSLAVEEQFYVLWPLIVFLFMRHSVSTAQRWSRQRHKAQSAALTVAVLGAEASALVGLFLLLIGTDPSRIYYGTDTRIQALLVGAALAVWRAQRPGPPSERIRSLLGRLGVVALVALVGVWATVNGQSKGLYAGGLLAVAIIVAVLVASVVEAPRGPVVRLLTVQPLPYIGRISYGLYLWHWPVFLSITSGRTGLSGIGLLLVRLAVTATITIASFHLVENPIRRGTFHFPRPQLSVPAVAGAVAVVVALSTGGNATVTTPSDLAGMAQKLEASGAQGAADPGASAGTPRPVRMLLTGDSVALSLAWGIGESAARNNVTVTSRAIIGCGVARVPVRKLNGKPGPLTDGCSEWPAHYQKVLAELAEPPDVVVFLAGRWEVTDQLFQGRWTHVGDPLFDAYLGRELDLAIDVLSSTGAPVAMLTTPVFERRETSSGEPIPETDPARVARFNELVRAAATRHPGVANVIEFGEMLTPGNTYTDTFHGTRIRADGVHLDKSGTGALGDLLLPQISAIARACHRDTGVCAR